VNVMKCEVVKQRIAEALELEDLPMHVVSHANGCAACAREISDRRALKFLIDDLGRVDAPPGFDTALNARLRAVPVSTLESLASGFIGWFRNPAAILAAGLMIFAAVGIAAKLRSSPGRESINQARGLSLVRGSIVIPELPSPTQTATASSGSAPNSADVSGTPNGQKESGSKVPALGKGPRSGIRSVDIAATAPKVFNGTRVNPGEASAQEITRIPVPRAALKVWLGSESRNEREVNLKPVLFGSQQQVDKQPALSGEATDEGIW
jgi:hypothetical protein